MACILAAFFLKLLHQMNKSNVWKMLWNSSNGVYVMFFQIPEIRSKLQEKYRGKWKNIAEKQAQEYFTLSDHEMKEHAQRWCYILWKLFSLRKLSQYLSIISEIWRNGSFLGILQSWQKPSTPKLVQKGNLTSVHRIDVSLSRTKPYSTIFNNATE